MAGTWVGAAPQYRIVLGKTLKFRQHDFVQSAVPDGASVTGGVVAKPGMATGSSGLCVLTCSQMMNNGSADSDDDPLEH